MSNHNANKGVSKTFNRRTLLRGIGGGTVLLSSFARQAQVRAAGATPGSFLYFFTPNGFVRSAFGSDGNGANMAMRESLRPVSAWKSKISVITGLCNGTTTDKASHEEITRSLTCVSGDDMYTGYATSLDQVLARHSGRRAMTVSAGWAQAPNWQSKLSWLGPNANDPHINDSRQIFQLFFANAIPETSGNTAMVDQLLLQKRSVLDFVREDIALFRGRVSAADRLRLDQHLTAVRDLEERLTRAPATPKQECNLKSIPLPDATNPAALQAHGELQMDLIATAFACGLSHSATLLWQGASGGKNPFGNPGHHEVSHGEAPQSVWKQIDAWYAERFAYWMAKASDLGIMDNTITVWGSEISEQHDQNNMTHVVAGGANLGIANNRTFVLPFKGRESDKKIAARDPANTNLSDLWVSVQNAMGVANKTFGELSKGGIPDLYRPV